jgi:hypothetical protein
MSEEEAKDEGLLGVFLVNKINTLAYKIQKKYDGIRILTRFRYTAITISISYNDPECEWYSKIYQVNIDIDDIDQLRNQITMLSRILHEGKVL